MSTDPDTFHRILALVETSLDDPASSPAELARQAYLSRFHFDRLVAAATGEPPGALRRRLLLERAAHRVTTTATGLLDIAVEAGYGSHEAFTRAFVAAYGRTPSAVRGDPPPTFRDLELPCPSDVHYQPPGGLRLPADRKESAIDVIQQLVDHHVSVLGEIIERMRRLPQDSLDAPIAISVETIDDRPTLRSVVNAMVTQEEHWLSALRGGGWPDESDRSVDGLAERHRVAGAGWRAFVARTLAEGRLADTFVDTTCEPPVTHSLGGTIGHVITFAAVRRTLAVGALESAGITDLGAGDPRPYLDSCAMSG